MHRNIRTRYNFDALGDRAEIRLAALQCVRKISGFTKSSAVNEVSFNRAVDKMAKVSSTLLGLLVTTSSPKNREGEAAKASARALRGFDSQQVLVRTLIQLTIIRPERISYTGFWVFSTIENFLECASRLRESDREQFVK